MASNWTIFLCSSCGVQVEVVKSEKVGRTAPQILQDMADIFFSHDVSHPFGSEHHVLFLVPAL